MQVTHNTATHEFEARDGNLTSRLVYHIDGSVMDIVHTEVPERLEGRGIAGELAAAAIRFAESNNLTVRPTCPFLRSYLERHPTTAPVIPPH